MISYIARGDVRCYISEFLMLHGASDVRALVAPIGLSECELDGAVHDPALDLRHQVGLHLELPRQEHHIDATTRKSD